MKKVLTALLSAALVLSMSACGSAPSSGSSPAESAPPSSGAPTASGDAAPAAGDDAAQKPMKAIMIVNGNLGDRAFFDSANDGVARLKADYGVETQVIETGADTAKWEPALADAAEEDVDLVIAITPSMAEYVQKIAPMYPEKKFFLIDAEIDYSAGDCGNVYCATFKQNEGSFLAGALAALVTKSEMPNVTPEKLIGFVGGMDVPVINDFLVGYIEGAQYADPETKVSITFAGDYYNPAKGKEFGTTLCNQNVDIIFAAAGETGLGVIEAAKEKNRYIIGVDTDQATQFAGDGDQASADIILSSMMKNVGDAIYRAVSLELKGELQYGAVDRLGVKEGGVGLAKNDIYNAKVDPEIIKQIEEIEAKVVEGGVEIKTAIGMSTDELNNVRNSVKP